MDAAPGVAKFELSKLLGAQEKLRKAETDAGRVPSSPTTAAGRTPLKTSSSSSVGFFQAVSEESMTPTLRHEVSQDRLAATASLSGTDLSPAHSIMDDDATNMGASDTSLASSSSSLMRHSRHNSSSDNNKDFSRKGFLFQIQDAKNSRKKWEVMAESDYYNDRDSYPMRVCMAENYGSGDSTKYKFWIYPRASAVCTKLPTADSPSSELHHAFVIVEESEPLYHYLDIDLPKEYRKETLHGKNQMDLAGYGIAMVRLLMSQILCVNALCIGDGYPTTASTERDKWSVHAHMTLAHNDRLSLADVMKKCNDRLEAAHKAGLKSVKPLFFRSTNKAGKEEDVCVVDKRVFTKKRNFRVPGATKMGKTAKLMPVSDRLPLWNRPESDMCASNQPYSGLSAYMILCRNSREMWTPNTLRNKNLLESGGHDLVGIYSNDFRCLPVTGNAVMYLKKIHYDAAKGFPLILSKEKYLKGDAIDGFYKWSTNADRIDGTIDECFDWVFKLLYGDDWRTIKRNAMVKRNEKTRTIESLMETCRKSPLHTQAVLVLLPHVYQPGKELDQLLIGTQDPALDSVMQSAEIIGDCFQLLEVTDENRAKAWNELWDFRCIVELHYSNTSTPEQKNQRKAYLKKLCSAVEPIFAGRTDSLYVASHNYDIRNCSNDVAFMDCFATELLLWSGQAIFVFQREQEAESLPLLDVLCQTPDEIAELIEKCVAYTCNRLGRIPDVPFNAVKARGAACNAEDATDLLAADLEMATAALGSPGKFWRESRQWQWESLEDRPRK